MGSRNASPQLYTSFLVCSALQVLFYLFLQNLKKFSLIFFLFFLIFMHYRKKKFILSPFLLFFFFRIINFHISYSYCKEYFYYFRLLLYHFFSAIVVFMRVNFLIMLSTGLLTSWKRFLFLIL